MSPSGYSPCFSFAWKLTQPSAISEAGVSFPFSVNSGVSPRGGMGLWTSAPLRYSGPGELERLCASVSPSVNGEPRVLASEGTRGIHPDDWCLDSRARTHRHPPGPAAVTGLSRGSRAQHRSQPCLTGRVTAGGESAPQCSVQRIRMRPARCWWAICDRDPHRGRQPLSLAGRLL